MKDILQDIVSHTHSLGLTLIKVSTDSNATKITALSDTKSVLLYGETHQRVDEFDGVFGMGHLEKLSLHLKNPEYQEDPTIEVVRETEEDGTVFPAFVHFENMLGDFQNDYRFLNYKIVDKQVKNYKFKGATWDLDFEPSVSSIARMKLMSAVHSEEDTFVAKTNNNNLIFSFGDKNNHASEYVFKSNVTGKLKSERAYPIAEVQAILSLSGDKSMQISSEQGAMQITLDSGLITYEYIIPVSTK